MWIESRQFYEIDTVVLVTEMPLRKIHRHECPVLVAGTAPASDGPRKSRVAPRISVI